MRLSIRTFVTGGIWRSAGATGTWGCSNSLVTWRAELTLLLSSVLLSWICLSTLSAPRRKIHSLCSLCAKRFCIFFRSAASLTFVQSSSPEPCCSVVDLPIPASVMRCQKERQISDRQAENQDRSWLWMRLYLEGQTDRIRDVARQTLKSDSVSVIPTCWQTTCTCCIWSSTILWLSFLLTVQSLQKGVLHRTFLYAEIEATVYFNSIFALQVT